MAPVSATLEIHHIDVGQGDATLIINRDLTALAAKLGSAAADLPNPIDHVPYAIANGIDLTGTVKKALLIDGGDDEYGGDIVTYLQRQGVFAVQGTNGLVPCLSVLVSHFHDDHIGGLRSIFKQRVDTHTSVATSGGPGRKRAKTTVTTTSIKPRYRPVAIYRTAEDPGADPVNVLRYGSFTQDIAQAQMGADGTTCTLIHPGGYGADGNQLEIDLGQGAGGIAITVTLFAAARCVYQPGTVASPPVPSVTRTVDQNDRSVVAVLQYGSFRAFLGGDIAGNGGLGGGNGANAMAGDRQYFSMHADLESPVGRALEAALPATVTPTAGEPTFPSAGYCTLYKADHHASSSSVDVHLLATLRPLIAVVSSGVKARFHWHPTQEAMNRMAASPQWTDRHNRSVSNSLMQGGLPPAVYLTEVAAKVKGSVFTRDLRGSRILGDIVVRPVDETVVALQDSTTMGGQLNVQVYGSGEQTTLGDPDTTLQPTEAVRAGSYPIGPYWHADVH